METLIVTIKNKSDLKLVSDLLKKMQIKHKILKESDKELIGDITETPVKPKKAIKPKQHNSPNSVTLKAMKEAEKGSVTKSKNLKDLITKLKS